MSCAKKDENDSPSSSSSSNSYLDPTNGAVIGSFTCAETESDSEDGSILNILRNGYVMNDEVIRPTQVEIAENFKKKNNDKEK